jgi:hypothetical protein
MSYWEETTKEAANDALYDAEEGATMVQYGTTKALKQEATVNGIHVNPILAFACLILPVVIFILTAYLLGSTLHYWHGVLAYILAIIVLLLVLGIGAGAGATATKSPGIALWLGILFAMSLIGWLYGYVEGNKIYSSCIEPSINIEQMTVYPNVDPSTSEGNQFMDFGVISFPSQATINQSMSMLFKDGTTYCVAPITIQGATPASYDFWAAGTDCCSKEKGFMCGDWNLQAARSGMRVTSEIGKEFFQLAVNAAAATYNIPAHHPIFFTWAEKPNNVLQEWMSNLGKSIWNGALVLGCVDVLILGIALIPITWMHGHGSEAKVPRRFEKYMGQA